jgi:hypothetical protein
MGAFDPIITYEKGTYIGMSTVFSQSPGSRSPIASQKPTRVVSRIASDQLHYKLTEGPRQGVEKSSDQWGHQHHPWRQVDHSSRYVLGCQVAS